MPYSAKGTVPPPFFHTIHDAVPIIAYRMLHAGAKIQSGGVQDGFLRLRYLHMRRSRALIESKYQVWHCRPAWRSVQQAHQDLSCPDAMLMPYAIPAADETYTCHELRPGPAALQLWHTYVSQDSAALSAANPLTTSSPSPSGTPIATACDQTSKYFRWQTSFRDVQLQSSMLVTTGQLGQHPPLTTQRPSELAKRTCRLAVTFVQLQAAVLTAKCLPCS